MASDTYDDERWTYELPADSPIKTGLEAEHRFDVLGELIET
jgi:hypothetical protein